VRHPPVALPAAVAALVAAGAAAPAPAAPRTVPRELERLRTEGAISAERAGGWRAAWSDAVRARRRLHGARRRELDAVLDNARAIAAAGLLTPSRGPALFLTVKRNRQWWASRPLLPPGARVLFRGSELVWQHYRGQGLQLQWLATFGRANALFAGRTYDARLRALLREAASLAVPGAGGIAWEGLFRFGGGRPPWVSGLTQGTAVQALSRAAIRLREPPLLGLARAALGVFRTPPPDGVRVRTAAGARYVIYSFAPRLRVLNAFVQALNGLLDFARYANDLEGRRLFDEGEAQLAAELADYDTGAWSRYSPARESDLGYHVLVRGFLSGLCERLRDEPRRAARYCALARRFTADLRRPPEVALLLPARAGRARRAVRVAFTLSKISVVTLTALRRGRVVWWRSARLGGGRHAFVLRPAVAGPLALRLRAVDLAGNAAAAAAVLHVRPAERRRS
jgi:hypothetical protein